MNSKQPIFFRSIRFQITALVILTEIVMLTIIGVVYFNRFSAEIDERIRNNVSIPTRLLNDGLLEFDAINNRQQLEDLVGEEIAEAFIVGINDNIFFSLNQQFLGRSFSTLNNPIAEIIDIETISEPAVIDDGAGRVISVAPLGGGSDGRETRFYAVLQVSNEQALLERQQLAQLFILGSLITVIITSAVITLVFNQSVFRRINTMLDILQQITNGDMSARVPQFAPDELGSLQIGINAMTDQLEDLINTLEERVADRTRDLSVTAQISRQLTTQLKIEELFPLLADLTAQEFGFYRVAVFAYDKRTQRVKYPIYEDPCLSRIAWHK